MLKDGSVHSLPGGCADIGVPVDVYVRGGLEEVRRGEKKKEEAREEEKKEEERKKEPWVVRGEREGV